MLRTDPRLFGTAHEPLWSLLYRYFFWDWLFRDVNQGDLLKRSASWRHNLAMRGCLPTYMARWLFCTALTALAAQGAEAATGPSVVPALFYTGSVLAVLVFCIALVLWMFLTKRQQA